MWSFHTQRGAHALFSDITWRHLLNPWMHFVASERPQLCIRAVTCFFLRPMLYELCRFEHFCLNLGTDLEAMHFSFSARRGIQILPENAPATDAWAPSKWTNQPSHANARSNGLTYMFVVPHAEHGFTCVLRFFVPLIAEHCTRSMAAGCE